MTLRFRVTLIYSFRLLLLAYVHTDIIFLLKQLYQVLKVCLKLAQEIVDLLKISYILQTSHVVARYCRGTIGLSYIELSKKICSFFWITKVKSLAACNNQKLNSMFTLA